MSEWVSLREFARREGVSPEAVSKAVEGGRLQTHDAGKRWPMLDYAEAKAAWDATRTARNNNRFGELPADETGDSVPNLDDERWGLRFTRAQALFNEEKAARAKLERLELEGLLHHADDVEKVLAAIFLAFRSRILAMPSKLASRIAALAGTTEIAKVQGVLDDSCREALSELARYDPRNVIRERKRRKRGR